MMLLMLYIPIVNIIDNVQIFDLQEKVVNCFQLSKRTLVIARPLLTYMFFNGWDNH